MAHGANVKDQCLRQRREQVDQREVEYASLLGRYKSLQSDKKASLGRGYIQLLLSILHVQLYGADTCGVEKDVMEGHGHRGRVDGRVPLLPLQLSC